MYSYVFGARKKPNVATTIRHRHPIVDVTKKKRKKQDLGDLWNPIINSTTLKSIYTERLRATEAQLCEERPASPCHRNEIKKHYNILYKSVPLWYPSPAVEFYASLFFSTPKKYDWKREIYREYTYIIYIVYITRLKTIQTCLNL